ncbi:MAG: peptidoglycan recognition family protein [Phycisphaerales bacterium]
MRQDHQGPRFSRRTKTVWGALAVSMTLVGGGLSALTGSTPGLRQGATLSPLASLSGPSSIESVFHTREPVADHEWNAIVIHHSASPVGSPQSIDEQHRAMGLTGLGYHFVIGNGLGMGDGEVHVGYRWLDQLPGAHVAGPAGQTYNRTSIGICLVGDGDRRAFTDAQMARLVELVSALMKQTGIPPERVYLHSDLASTRSPGAYFPAAEFRELIRAAP